MKLDPHVEALLQHMHLFGDGPIPAEDIPAMREAVEQLLQAASTETVVEGVATEDVLVDDISVRLFRPIATNETELPLHVYFHGGGYIFGSAGGQDGILSQHALAAGCVVASVEYRLAPEHRFPAGLEDAADLRADTILVEAACLGGSFPPGHPASH
jgi:acetyl esterase